MSESVVVALFAGLVLALYVMAWRITGELPTVVKLTVRLGLPLLILGPVLVFALLALEHPRDAGAPPPASVDAARPPPPAAAPRPADEEAAPGGAVPEPEMPSAAEPDTETAPGRGIGADGASPSPVAEAGESQGEWDVVPVYYGTDRARAETAQRLEYGNGRGRKLEIGQALVTVPRSHTVPQIERPWAVRIPYLDVTLYEEQEDPNSHFTLKELKTLSQEEFLTLVRQRLAASERYKNHALIFVHGFNTTFDFALFRTAQIAYDLKFDGAPFSYSWPSGGGLSSYTYDRESSGQSQPFLKEFMKLVLEQSGAKAVSVVAHSMGNQPTLQVLRDLKAAKPDGVVFHQIILAAPDVDRDNFENISREIQGLANGITLYAAGNDVALGLSRRVNGGIPRAGDVPETGPLVLPGVDTIDVTAVSTDSLGLNHSGYAENNELLLDVRQLIETGVRPPDKRTAALVSVDGTGGRYWRFPPPPP